MILTECGRFDVSYRNNRMRGIWCERKLVRFGTLGTVEAGQRSSKAERLDAVLYHLAESLRIIAILISPVLPKAAAGIFAQLNWDKPFRLEDAQWGGLPDGHVLGTPTPLFPRIETAPPA